MCGIVGYVGNRDCYDILIKGLHRLEYRGYDSAGVALVGEDGNLNVYKAKGKVSELERIVQGKDCSGTVGIAHTRWATHGEPSVINAHPQCSQSGQLALVHNGIIENYAILRKQLEKRGFVFRSNTDTEVLVQLIEHFQRAINIPIEDAVRLALKRSIGAYAIAVVDKRCPDRVIVARKGSPLVIGVGDDNREFFVASDATPITEHTQHVAYLDDEQIAICKPGTDLTIIDFNKTVQHVQMKDVELDLNMLDKGKFSHYMLKEIFEQPQCIRDCMRGRLFAESGETANLFDGYSGSHALNDVVLSAVRNNRERLLSARRFIIVACGTSWHAGLLGKQLIEQYCRIPVEVDYASEFRYRNPVIYQDDVIIAISQSGETADTLAALELGKAAGAMIFGIVNVVGSSISRQTDTGIYIHVGPEIGVASTKAFTGQLTCLYLLTLAMAHLRGSVSEEKYVEMVQELARIPDKMAKVLEVNSHIEQLSEKFSYVHNFLYLGRGWDYPVALEGALKLKEISYIHAEGYPAAEMKHGPIALVDADMPVLFIATHHQQYQKIISNMQEVKARGGHILAVVTEGDEHVRNIADDIIEVPATLPVFSPMLSVVPLQLLAYHVAVKKGLNVDMPRNLAKSVTVE